MVHGVLACIVDCLGWALLVDFGLHLDLNDVLQRVNPLIACKSHLGVLQELPAIITCIQKLTF